MPKTRDFRGAPFDIKKIKSCGQDVGGKVYPKLYAIENLVRVIVHSVLSAQLGKQWWDVAAAPDLQKEVTRLMKGYGSKPWHSAPGRHEVYYVYLSDLTKILTSNSNSFIPHVPDVDQWTAKLEQIRVPRNIVGHMNWLTDTDRSRIDVCLADIEQLVGKLASSSSLTLVVP